MQHQPIMEPDRRWIWILLAAVAIAAAGLGLWRWRSSPAKQDLSPPSKEGRAGEESPPLPPPAPSPSERSIAEAEPDPAWAGVIEALDSRPAHPTPADAASARRALSGLLAAPGETEGPAGGAVGYGLLSRLTRELVEKPPSPSGELSNPETFLANVFHLSRVLGKEQTLEAKALLAGRREDLEPLAAAYYQWLITREFAADPQEREISLPLLYDYASYLLDSFGGRAYLLRRLPRQEALATFYALMMVDRAAQAGISSNGTDPRPHLQRCRQLLETQDLAYRKQYLAALDRLASRWP